MNKYTPIEGEPEFNLLGRDPSAPRLVREWAIQRRADISLGERPATDQEKVDEAFELADRMETWRRENYGAWRQQR